MTRRGQVLELARWELVRYFKLRDLVITVALVAGISAASYGFTWWQQRSQTTVRLAVVSPLPVDSPSSRLVLEPRDAAELPALREAVERDELDGVLVIAPPEARLIARARPGWVDDASAVADAALRAHRLGELGIDPAALAAALTPAPLQLELLAGDDATGAGSGLAIVVVALMMGTLFFGLGYLFVSITGEKQQRVTEQLFVMAPAGAIMDGKLLGCAALAVVSAAQTLAVGVVAYEVWSGGLLDWLRGAFGSVSVADAAALIAFAAAGFAFWFTLSAAWFATIGDPNSSARSNALLLPFLPLSAVFIGLSDPDSAMMQVLGILPLTSMTVMPARLVLTEVSAPELLLSLALLVAATFALRRAAARCYEAAMLMYGKEPGAREMLRWLRAAR